MSEDISALGEHVAATVSGWTGKKARNVRADLLGLVIEQAVTAQTTKAPAESVADLARRFDIAPPPANEGASPSVAEVLACEECLSARGRVPLKVPGVLIEVPELLEFDQQAWFTLFDLSEAIPRHWALVGGQMVHLHCWQRGRPAPRVTTDTDIIMDIRARKSALTDVTRFLQDRGFDEVGRGPRNIGHRWSRGRVMFDVLVPEGAGDSGSKARTILGARTVQVPGGTQALERAQRVEVEVAGRVGTVTRPSLLGALVGKSAALEIPVDPNSGRHASDFVTLASLIDNPAGMSALTTSKDRQRVLAMLARVPESDPSWTSYGSGVAARGTAVMTFRPDVPSNPSPDS